MTEYSAILAILSLCIVAVVVVYMRHTRPKETTQSSQLTISTPIKESKELQRGVEVNSTKSETKGDDFAEPADKFGSQTSSEGIKMAFEESGTQSSSEKYPTPEGGQEGLTAAEVKGIISVPLGKRPPHRGPYGTEQEQTKKNRLKTFKPDIVCWKREREWILVVEIPDGQQADQRITVHQNNTPLIEDSQERGCWLLTEVHGEVVIGQYNNERKDNFTISLGNENYLLFKLSSHSLNQGRRVRRASSGFYLIVVSEDLWVDNELGSSTSAAPEPVNLKGYQAYFFDIKTKRTCDIVFHGPCGESLPIGSSGPYFDLLGQQIHDVSADVGPLFAGSLPCISISAGSWKDIGTIVVGEEGRGKGTWRRPIKPKSDSAEQDLPAEIAERKAGWYFVRFYDLDDQLIDSLDFRFVMGLREITIREISPLPSTDGHGQSNIDFYYEQGYDVQLSEPCDRSVAVEMEAEKTTASIPAMPELDRSHWLVGCINGPMVPVTILLERVWWALGSEQESEFTLTDRCLSCSREDLLATSDKIIILRLPQPGWIEYLHVGFSETSFRRYRTQANDPIVAIPLRDFGDSPEMRTVGRFPLLLRFYRANTMHQAPLCMLHVKSGCKVCSKFSTFSEQELFSHMVSLHLSTFFRDLTYEEYREHEPTLPLAIYQCLYCHFYVRTDNPSNPTSTILDHIMKDCIEARSQNPVGPVRISFRVVSDIDEIRAKLSANLPHIKKCKLCAHELENPDEKRLLVHLRDKHKSSCIELL
jgi:hypothetical protein